MKISEELRDKLIELLQTASSRWYDDPNGPWGHECPFCFQRSTDGCSPPPHDDDCEAMQAIEDLNNLNQQGGT